jgi:hypothetical protein
MALLDVVKMSDAVRDERRETDEATYHRVRSILAAGTQRSKAFTKAAGQMGTTRDQVIAGYWRHVKRTGAPK